MSVDGNSGGGCIILMGHRLLRLRTGGGEVLLVGVWGVVVGGGRWEVGWGWPRPAHRAEGADWAEVRSTSWARSTGAGIKRAG